MLIGISAFAFLSTRWLNRVANEIAQVADGELSSSTDMSGPIREFNKIDQALRQLRLDALQLIDLKSKSRAAEQIEYMAMDDALTDLANRRYLEKYKEAITNQWENSLAKEWLEIFHIDLDRFKEINDTDGHETGDRILCSVASRLKSMIPESGSIFRVGGDEFVVIVEHEGLGLLEENELVPSDMGDTIVDGLARAYTHMGKSYCIGASVGVVTVMKSMANIEEALGNADIAMYAAKARGKNCKMHFTSELRANILEKKTLAEELETALCNGEITPYYQPQVNSRTFEVSGAEALVRWQHPTRGILTPSHFIEIAQERGLLSRIDQFVFKQVCQQIRTWQRHGYRVPRLSINISVSRLSDPSFLEDIRNANIEPGSIAFELIETVCFDDVSETVLRTLDLVRELGISFELDDFGTGYASIVSLLKIAPNKLKIDRTFIREVSSNDNQMKLVSHIVEIGVSLGISVTAEGIEDIQQAEILRDLGCDTLQGWYFGRPTHADQFCKEHLQREVKSILPGKRVVDRNIVTISG